MSDQRTCTEYYHFVRITGITAQADLRKHPPTSTESQNRPASPPGGGSNRTPRREPPPPLRRSAAGEVGGSPRRPALPAGALVNGCLAPSSGRSEASSQHPPQPPRPHPPYQPISGSRRREASPGAWARSTARADMQRQKHSTHAEYAEPPQKRRNGICQRCACGRRDP